MSTSINKKDSIVVDLYDQKISQLPIKDPDELERILIHSAEKLADGNETIVFEALMNALVDYYVFCLEPGDDIMDIGFLVSETEDRACNAVAFRRALIESRSEDHLTEEDIPSSHEDENVSEPEDENGSEEADDEDDDLPTEISAFPPSSFKSCDKCSRDPDDITDKDIPGMMKRFECDGFEVSVKLIPKMEF